MRHLRLSPTILTVACLVLLAGCEYPAVQLPGLLVSTAPPGASCLLTRLGQPIAAADLNAGDRSCRTGGRPDHRHLPPPRLHRSLGLDRADQLRRPASPRAIRRSHPHSVDLALVPGRPAHRAEPPQEQRRPAHGPAPLSGGDPTRRQAGPPAPGRRPSPGPSSPVPRGGRERRRPARRRREQHRHREAERLVRRPGAENRTAEPAPDRALVVAEPRRRRAHLGREPFVEIGRVLAVDRADEEALDRERSHQDRVAGREEAEIERRRRTRR